MLRNLFVIFFKHLTKQSRSSICSEKKTSQPYQLLQLTSKENDSCNFVPLSSAHTMIRMEQNDTDSDTSHNVLHVSLHFTCRLSFFLLFRSVFLFPFCSLFAAAVCLRKLHTHFKMFTFDQECAHYTTCSVSRSLYPVSCLHCTERFPSLFSHLSLPSVSPSLSVAQNGVGVCSGALRGHCMAWRDK